VRPLEAGEIDHAVAIAASLPEAPHWRAEVYKAALEPASSPQPQALPRRQALAAEVDGALAGFAVASLVADEAELESIAVAPTAQRRGVGRALLKELMASLGSLGVGRLLLEVRASNRQAIAFYDALGFRECGRRPRYYVDPEEDAVLMERVLL
jgi:ribosomal-protein-alanine acetyltransferase